MALAGGRFVTKAELKNKIRYAVGKETSNRTIENDLLLMRECSELGFYAPIKYDYYAKGYHYTDPSYSIFNVALLKEARRLLRSSVQVINDDRLIVEIDQFINKVKHL